MRRGALAALVAAAVAVPVMAVAPAVTPAPAPGPSGVSALTAGELAAGKLRERYEANRGAMRQAAGVAERYGDGERAVALRALAADGRQFLAFDGRGGGRAVEVLGDLRSASRIAVLVPGSDTNLDTFDPSGAPYKTLGGSARALWQELERQGAGGRTAVVAWLGYATPRTVSTDVLTQDRAEEGAGELRAFVGSLRASKPAAPLSLLCHSYGSVVCGRAAARGLEAADIALYGSPGVGVDSAAGLRTTARVWAGRGGEDWIAKVPNAQLDVLGTTVGFGADPVDADFGARRFDAGRAEHSGYHRPGSRSLHHLALIALGRGGEVPRG